MQRFQTDEHALWISKAKISTENDFNREHFGTEGNHETSNNEENLVCIFC